MLHWKRLLIVLVLNCHEKLPNTCPIAKGMMSFEYSNSLPLFEVRHQVKAPRNVVFRHPNLHMFGHKFLQILLCVNIVNSLNNLMLLFIPFSLAHLLEPVLAKLHDDLRSALMDVLCVFENSIPHYFEVKVFKENGAHKI